MALAFPCAGMVLLVVVDALFNILSHSPRPSHITQAPPSAAPPHATVQDRQQVRTNLIRQLHIFLPSNHTSSHPLFFFKKIQRRHRCTPRPDTRDPGTLAH